MPTAPHDLSDSEARRIVRRIRKGDGDAFGEFYDRFFDPCVALTQRITKRDESFSLDVVQDVMIAVADRLPRLKTAAALSSWLRRSLYTTAIDHLRTASRVARREQNVSRPELSEESNPEEHAIAAERIDWLDRALRELEDDERTLVMTRFGESQTLVQSGAQVGIGGNAAHGRIRRILAKLRAAGRMHIENES